MALVTLDYGMDDGTGQLVGHVVYDDANGNQITRVDWDNQSQTDWNVRILSGGKPPLNTVIRKGRSGAITSPTTLAGYLGDPLLIEIGGA